MVTVLRLHQQRQTAQVRTGALEELRERLLSGGADGDYGRRHGGGASGDADGDPRAMLNAQ